jgi:hypothetical protein
MKFDVSGKAVALEKAETLTPVRDLRFSQYQI